MLEIVWSAEAEKTYLEALEFILKNGMLKLRNPLKRRCLIYYI